MFHLRVFDYLLGNVLAVGNAWPRLAGSLFLSSLVFCVSFLNLFRSRVIGFVVTSLAGPRRYIVVAAWREDLCNI